MSGLSQYALTKAEDQFLKTALEDFDKNRALTEPQEDRLESLYKEKSQSIPNKKSDRFAVKKSNPKKVEPRRPRTRVFWCEKWRKQRFGQIWRDRIKEIDASSKEYQIVKMTGMMNFHIDPAEGDEKVGR